MVDCRLTKLTYFRIIIWVCIFIKKSVNLVNLGLVD